MNEQNLKTLIVPFVIAKTWSKHCLYMREDGDHVDFAGIMDTQSFNAMAKENHLRHGFSARLRIKIEGGGAGQEISMYCKLKLQTSLLYVGDCEADPWFQSNVRSTSAKIVFVNLVEVFLSHEHQCCEHSAGMRGVFMVLGITLDRHSPENLLITLD